MSFVVKQANGCWEWTGHMTKSGYGTFCEDAYPIRAHRYSFKAHNGPLLSGMQIDHLCRNRACVNPEHLEQVTAMENVRRAIKAVRSIPYDKPIDRCPSGHVYADYGGPYTWRGCTYCRECRRILGRERYLKNKAAEYRVAP